ncbi:DUF6252 family protein [Lacinutrix algicola]|uniref:DUF6252 family protein n=1 Tax=Lacinutrix algicola TaxID=342954 RepID=UPI0006E30FD3|nr:DUF6252 family protein [Lacinutrix algicola]
MKKIIALILVTITFFGCGEDLEFKTPSFQGEKDGNLWEAASFRANINALGVLTIVASDNFETITLEVDSPSIGIHDIVETTSTGALEDIDGIFYSSNNSPDPSVQLYPAAGMIDLKDVNLEEGYVSGEFYFNAFNSSGLTSINVNKGFFHKVPLIVSSVISGSVSAACSSASAVAAATLINYNAVAPGDANFVDVCNAYKTALINEKATCGDDDGSIQTIINGLTCL